MNALKIRVSGQFHFVYSCRESAEVSLYLTGAHDEFGVHIDALETTVFTHVGLGPLVNKWDDTLIILFESLVDGS